MAETSNVCLVRCPHCENILPEPPGFSVYQCGGCGAVLQAKKKELFGDGLLETSDNERVGGVFEKGDVDNVGLTSVSGPEMDGNGISKRNNDENIVLHGGSSLGVENIRVVDDFDGSIRGRERSGLGFDENKQTRYTKDEYKISSKVPNDECVRDRNNCDVNTNRPEHVKLTKDELEKVRRLVKSMRSRPVMDQLGLDRNGSRESHANASTVAGQGSYANFQYPDVGPSGYVRGSSYNYGERMRYDDDADGLARVETFENDRVELLRRLDELTDQLSRSCEIVDKPIDHDCRVSPVPPDTYDRHDAFMEDGMRQAYGVNKQPLASVKHVSKAPYVTYNHSYVPYIDRHGIAFQESYPSGNFAYQHGGFADVYQPQILRRPSHQPPSRYFRESCYRQLPGHDMDFNRDLFMSNPHNTFFDQPACSCLQCINKNRHVSSKIPPQSLCDQNTQSTYTDHNLYQRINHITHDPQGHISDSSDILPLQSRDKKHLTRSSSDLCREKVGFGRSHLKKVAAVSGSRQLFHPIAGGAPFITCCTCFELLKLPRKLFLKQKDQRKIKCRSCSSVLSFELDGKGIVISVPTTSEQGSKKVHTSSSEMPEEKYQSSHDYTDTGALGNCDANESFNFHCQLADAEPILSSGDHKSNYGRSEMRQDPNSFTSSSSEDEQSPDSPIHEKEACSAEFPLKDEVPLLLPDSPSHKNPGHSPGNLVHKYGSGNKSKRVDEDRNIQDGKTSLQNSLKDTMLSTEMDVSCDDHCGLIYDSVDINKEEDLPRINKGGESFFVGLIKRSFGDFSRSSKSTESGKSNVSINGRFIPDRVVKKAEKMSGPIQPGEYWYDVRAGFWGVMGHPCFGIILPNIEEFNYPMVENCAGGNTEVFVNGRELHQKDLVLLSSRGLPIKRHKSYLIDISGRVVDEDTGEELDGLGKLAPTVERAKHGFGMKIPKSLLQQ